MHLQQSLPEVCSKWILKKSTREVCSKNCNRNIFSQSKHKTKPEYESVLWEHFSNLESFHCQKPTITDIVYESSSRAIKWETNCARRPAQNINKRNGIMSTFKQRAEQKAILVSWTLPREPQTGTFILELWNHLSTACRREVTSKPVIRSRTAINWYFFGVVVKNDVTCCCT